MPYLPIETFDNKLKMLCVVSLIAILMSLFFGWNGTGGILFAIYWEKNKGSKLGIYGYFLAMIIAGEILMENRYNLLKFVEFIPGFLIGYVNS